MRKKNETVHLLILDQSQNDAEEMVSLLRNSGRATRAHRVTSEEDLLDSLKEHSWDLFLAREEDVEFDASAALSHIKRLDKDIPFIILNNALNDEAIVNYMRAGAQDVIPFEDRKHLVLAINRELTNLYERRNRRSIEVHLREAEKRCQLLLDSSKDAIAYINDGMHIYANGSYMDFMGYDDVDDLICIPVLDTLTPDSQADFKTITKLYNEGEQEPKQLSTVTRRSDDSEVKVLMSFSVATYDSEPCTQIVVRPEQDSAELEEKLKEISSQDLLTGLYNRQYLMEKLNEAIELAVSKSQTGALYYIALDSFVQIKSNAGIAGADLVLSDVANVLREQTEESWTLARIGDDAYGLLAMSQDDNDAEKTAEKIRSAIEQHMSEVSGRTIQVTTSIGIALINESSPKAQDILGRSHIASDEVKNLEGKETGNGAFTYVSKADDDGDDSSVSSLQKALDENRFKLLFQPVISLRGESEEHYEAFLRMMDNEGNEVSPYDFLPPAGPSEMASKIDRWVILQTIKHLSGHRSKGHETNLFLNLTAETIQDKTFLPWLSVALKAARLPGDSLIFQINEADAGTYLKLARDFAKGLKQLHCKVSISRFGCALNPFNTLKYIEADYVKLDGSFTDEIQKDEESREQVKEMITSLQAQGKLTIVPLVESASILSTLWQAGVNFIQGYYLQAPTTEMNYDFSEE